MHIGLADPENRTEWDAFVIKHSQDEFLQSWEWGNFQSSYGRRVWRFVVRQGNTIYGVSTAICMEIRRGLHYVYVPRGPVIREGLTVEQQSAIASLFSQHWRLIGLESNSIFVRIEPNSMRTLEELKTPTQVEKLLLSRGWLKIYNTQPQYTTIVSLEESHETILKRMHHKTRYNIRLAEKKGLVPRMITDEKDFQIFWKLHAAAAARDKFMTYSYDYYRKIFNILLDDEDKPDRTRAASRVFVIEKSDGTPLAAALIIVFGTKVVYLYGGSDHKYRHLMAPYLLHWYIMKRAKKNGFLYYDFWGVIAPGTKVKHPWQGVTRFKMGFGGTTYVYPGAFDFPYKKRMYKIYTLLKRARRFL